MDPLAALLIIGFVVVTLVRSAARAKGRVGEWKVQVTCLPFAVPLETWDKQSREKTTLTVIKPSVKRVRIRRMKLASS